MTKQPEAYIWRCYNGHEQAVFEARMRQSVVKPSCIYCGSRLSLQVCPFPTNPSDEQAGLPKEQ